MYRPYLYLETTKRSEFLVAAYLTRRYHYIIIDHVEKENLDLVYSIFSNVYVVSIFLINVFRKIICLELRANLSLYLSPAM